MPVALLLPCRPCTSTKKMSTTYTKGISYSGQGQPGWALGASTASTGYTVGHSTAGALEQLGMAALGLLRAPPPTELLCASVNNQGAAHTCLRGCTPRT